MNGNKCKCGGYLTVNIKDVLKGIESKCSCNKCLKEVTLFTEDVLDDNNIIEIVQLIKNKYYESK